ncbi:MAG: transaldolase [Helicobacter sp.]|uniref:transaldolase n=1 Tax=Helicobacter sp. TaxID=218 RepID=UPI0025C08C1D|nr:transaldolase [Helicobacter sp.]MCH5313564.1 transaldolase [Helicobacter sp.]
MFSLWCDFIQRDFLENEFRMLIDSGLIQGATSNPSIFAQSLKTPAYAAAIASLKGKNAKDIYEHLAIADIKRAAEILKPLWEKNNANGFISLEIDPFLCDDAPKSIDEGVRLHKSIAMPNVMIKVPATPVGYEVMSALVQRDISVNATLIFTPHQAKECALAMQEGIKKAGAKEETKEIQNTAPHSKIQGVISVFVSRFDRAVDSALGSHLRGQMGIINAMDCYEVIEGFKHSSIRTLFASTGVKGEDLPKSYYIDSLILPHSVNTAPLESIRAYEQSTNKAQKTLLSPKSRHSFWESLSDAGIHREDISQKLLNEGIVAFQQSFEDMLRAL